MLGAFVASFLDQRRMQTLGILWILLWASAFHYCVLTTAGADVTDVFQKIVDSAGHTVFLMRAQEHPFLTYYTTGYVDRMLSGEETNVFVLTKPIATPLLYWLPKLAARVWGTSEFKDYLQVLCWSFSMLGVLTCIPLSLIAKERAMGARWYLAPMFYMLMPNTNSAALHLDQVIFPGVTAWTLWATFKALRYRAYGAALTAGVCFGISLLFSFGLIPVGFVMAFLLLRHRINSGEPILLKVFLIVGGMLGVFVLADVCLGYNWFQHYPIAARTHAATRWYAMHHGLVDLPMYFVANCGVYLFFTGIPVFVVFVGGWIEFSRRDSLGFMSQIGYGAILIAILSMMSFSTIGETERLWLYANVMLALFLPICMQRLRRVLLFCGTQGLLCAIIVFRFRL
jgi:hypothetical protein